MKKQQDSPAYEVLRMIWRNTNRAVPFSYERLNHAMHAALSLAVGAGMEFHEDDFSRISEEFNWGYWLGVPSEWVYALAVCAGNRSAWKAWEKFKGRPPFYANRVSAYGNYYIHGGVNRMRERLFVGARLAWDGVREVTVTSFSDDGAYLTACAYKYVNEQGHRQKKITRRWKITHADLAKAFPAPKRKKAAERFRELTGVDPTQEKP